MNSILVSCAGRRVSLLELFQNAAHRRGWEVIAGDCDALAPSLYLADKAVYLPRVTSENYIPALLNIVEAHSVRLIVPTIDTELLVLATNADRFLNVGCRVLISSPEFVAICGDKWIMAAQFSRRGIATPASWLPSARAGAALPKELFIKPRDGSASANTYKVDREKLDQILPLVPNAIIQEELKGSEITIDALIDFNGALLHYVPRIRLRTLAGESIQGRTISDSDIRPWLVECLTVAADMGARGAITLQAFLTPDGPVLTEINPRFGGGFPLGHAAGAHYPEWIIQLLEERRLQPRLGEYSPNLYMTRYYREHFFTAPLWEKIRH
ncbi:MAG: ATP-grasp domain-containing protein [Terracidiphilus sp.]|jgi:carbamoyl-phosphate synthase large subunit